ncbi:MAG: hypothetical protein MUE85_23475 [Microscillaceae bacterium]|jgi:hypothetical protein|nr:hypothetical protein [Microscillaceae bacterium]
MQKYDTDLENIMISHYNSLGERTKRHYAGLEALKLGFGGKKYICDLFQMSKNTLRKGILELKSGKNPSEELGNRQRKVGGGRKNFFCPMEDLPSS